MDTSIISFIITLIFMSFYIFNEARPEGCKFSETIRDTSKRFFRDDMGLMVKIATILSFLTAPFYAILNFILIAGKHTPREHHPSIYMKILSFFGIVFLIGFSIWFILNL